MKTLLLILLTSLTLAATPNVGDNEVAFNLPSLYQEDTTISNADLHGKVTLVNLWASWCTGCQEEMPLFVALQNKFPKEQFEIVLINIDSDKQNGIDFMHDVDPSKSLTALFNEDKTMAKSYKCLGMPSSFLIDKNGKILEIFTGSLDEEALEDLEKKLKTLTGK